MVKRSRRSSRFKFEVNFNGMPLVGTYHLAIMAIGKALFVIGEHHFIKQCSCDVITLCVCSIKEILEGQKGDPLLFPAPNGHDGLFEFLTTSWHAQLGLNLALFGSLTIIIAHHMYAMPPYPYIGIDYPTQLSIFTHHTWIGGFLIVGAGAHAAIAMIRDYDPAKHVDNVLDRVLKARDALISHLNWVCIWLGFHSFGLYIHNDTMRALGRPQDMFSDSAIQLKLVFAHCLQDLHAAAAGTTVVVVAHRPATIAVADEVELLRAAETDGYGRTLGYFFVNGRNYSVLVVAAGGHDRVFVDDAATRGIDQQAARAQARELGGGGHQEGIA